MQSVQSETTPPIVRLVVDIGNTTTSLALFTGAHEPAVESMPSDRFADPGSLREVTGKLIQNYGAPQAIAVCSVVPAVSASGSVLLQSLFSLPVMTVGSALRLPFRLEYDMHHTFGADRIALCAWSRNLFEDRAVIAVDIGTAITFDVLDSAGTYRGGLIMPGIDMMAGALHSRTAQLPLVDIRKPEGLLGRSTAECIRSGIYWGAVKKIEGLIETIADELTRDFGESTVEVIVTGGNSRLIASEIVTISVIDELAVIRGIDLLLRMNLP
jgi:type III pantothenate kinase